MRSTFYGLEIGRTGLTVSQKGLDVTGHNISNVDTAGYTRQRLSVSAYDPYSATMKFKNAEMGAIGGGARVKMVDQIRSVFLDRQYRTEQNALSYWNTRVTGLTYVEALFEGEGSASLSQGILDLFTAFNTLGTEANDAAQRTNVRSAAQSLCDSLGQMYDRLVDLQESENLGVELVVGQVNDYAESLTQLNRAIYYYELDGQPANDLRDKRNLLLDELSALVDIHYEETADNRMIVKIGAPSDPNAFELVNYTSRTEIKLDKTATDPVTGIPISKPYWTDDTAAPPEDKHFTADLLGGELRAHMHLRDNSSSDTAGIPYFIQQLNTLARTLVETINTEHALGYTHPASGSPSATGINFFDDLGDLSLVSAKTIALSAEVQASIYNIAASDTKINLTPPVDGEELQEGNQNVAKAINKILDRTDIPGVGSIFGFMSSIEQDIATTLKYAKTNQATANTNLLSVDTQRQSVSGVSLDEEMTSLIKYQHAYSGASRIITAMDEALETLINRMGRVGL